MLFADGAVLVALTLFWVYTLLDVITADESRVRNLPKLTWLLLVVLLLEVGALVWWVAGRPQREAAASGPVPPGQDRSGRAGVRSPDDDEAFLAQLRARAEEQRKRAAEQARLLRQQEDDPPPHP